MTTNIVNILIIKMSSANFNEIYHSVKNLKILSKEQINYIDDLSFEEKVKVFETFNDYIVLLKIFDFILNIASAYVLIYLFVKFLKNIIKSKEKTVPERTACFNLIMKDKTLSFNIKNK